MITFIITKMTFIIRNSSFNFLIVFLSIHPNPTQIRLPPSLNCMYQLINKCGILYSHCNILLESMDSGDYMPIELTPKLWSLNTDFVT